MFYILMLIGGFSLSLRLVDGQERAAFQKYGFGFAYGNFRQILHHYLSAVKVPSSRKMKMTVHSIVLVSHSVIPLILRRIQTAAVFTYVNC